MNDTILFVGAIAAALMAIGVFLGWAFRQIRMAGKFVEAVYTLIQREFPEAYGPHDGCPHGQSTQARVKCIHSRVHEVEVLLERHIDKAEALAAEVIAKVHWIDVPPDDSSLR